METQKGEDIFTSILQAIKESRVAIIVFSKNYARSVTCMSDTEKIMECYRTKGQKVVPVFYDVDPSEVRHQKGPFENAFADYMERFSEDEVKVWRAALTGAANLAGIDLRNCRYFSFCLFVFRKLLVDRQIFMLFSKLLGHTFSPFVNIIEFTFTLTELSFCHPNFTLFFWYV